MVWLCRENLDHRESNLVKPIRNDLGSIYDGDVDQVN